MNNDFKEL